MEIKQNKRLQREYNELIENPIEDVKLEFLPENFNSLWKLILKKNDGSNLEIDIQFKNIYPFKPPILKTRDPINSEIINVNGEIRLPILARWMPTKCLRELFEALKEEILSGPKAEIPKFTIKTLTGHSFDIDYDPTLTIKEIKDKYCELEGIKPENQKLFFKTTILQDGDKLE